MEHIFKYKNADESTGFLLWKVTNLWQREIRKTLKKENLTHTQFVVLASTFWLSESNKNLTQIEIANHIGIDKMLTSNVIKKLIEKGLLKRIQHKIDTRAKAISTTEKGTETLKKSVKEVEKFDISFFGQLSKKNEFNKELLRLMNNNGG